MQDITIDVAFNVFIDGFSKQISFIDGFTQKSQIKKCDFTVMYKCGMFDHYGQMTSTS